MSFLWKQTIKDIDNKGNIGTYERTTTLEDRLKESKSIIEKHPDKIPIIVEYHKGVSLPNKVPNKFLVPNSFTFGEFLGTLRKKIELKPEHGIFVFIDNTIPSMTINLGQLYKEKKKECGFLYLEVSTENTFGSYQTIWSDYIYQ